MIEVRPIRPSEVPLLREFLFLAIHQPDETYPISRKVLDDPQVAAYIEDWGRPEDRCLVAVVEANVVGAVWTRILSGPVRGFGNIDTHTPEFAISVLPEYRGRGVGSRLMRDMIAWLRRDGAARASLSVQRSNPARHLYERLGFETVKAGSDELVMKLELRPERPPHPPNSAPTRARARHASRSSREYAG